MADEASAAVPFDAGTSYDVKLMRPTTYRGAPVLPLHSHEMTGEALNEIVRREGADFVDFANPL